MAIPLATSNIEKVLTVFQGIADGDTDLATKYIHPTKFIQHNPVAADGVSGLKAYISRFPRENHHLKVVRAFHDGPYVFTQEDGAILGQNTFFDVFRFEDDWIVEQWGFSEKSAPPNKSGHMQ
jgi:predicted SnoaL-like aldol condensation-catalyzing enzyme